MEAYSLNPQILPGQPLTQKEHHRAMTWLIAMIVLLIITGGLYWYERAQKPAQAPADDESAMRARVGELLREAPVQASQAEIDRVAALLSHSNTAPSDTDTQAVANALKK